VQVRIVPGSGPRPFAEPGARLVAAVPLAVPAVDARIIHIGLRVVAAAGLGGAVGPAPAVARGVDDDARIVGESPLDEPVAEVERGFGRRKQWRAVATRYDKLGNRYAATCAIAAIMDWTRARPDQKSPDAT
jgi:hypothetical protein